MVSHGHLRTARLKWPSEACSRCTLGLIQNLKDRGIGELKDGTKHDLKEIDQLTERGKYYLERVRQQVNHDA